PAGGMQVPCVLAPGLSERQALDAARRDGIDLLGLTGLHASARHKAGFLMGFAAHAPNEQEVAIRKLAGVLRALKQP
ncbi:MAG: PLP-dependent aminotransferase family protein, partial [Achromobacter sp.]|nr:PLP-dependent aminotransferase family protein [Achromobacter sp.]